MSSVAAPEARGQLSAKGGSARSAPPRASAAPTRVRVLLTAIAAAVLGAWAGVRYFDYSVGTPLGYWLGVAGGVAMLVVFLYPLRKRIAFTRTWGAPRYWFAVHMVCGIVGPLIVLVHSGFHVGSINAGVALTSMLLVAGSGILGRFIYLRIHHGLSGAHWTVRELQDRIGANSSEVRSRLSFAPKVEAMLQAFHAQASKPAASIAGRWWAFLTLSARAKVLQRRCRRDLAIALRARAAGAGWEPRQTQRALAKASRLVGDYLDAVQRAAQLAAYERLFSLWHVLHVPLVWMLILSAIAHVVAVHAY
jgi:hypothetical protein